MVGVRNAMIIMIIGYAAVYLAGCAAHQAVGDHFSMSGTPAGIQAFADLSNGLIRTGKESPEQSSEFFAHRKTQESAETVRHSQGFWQRLVN